MLSTYCTYNDTDIANFGRSNLSLFGIQLTIYKYKMNTYFSPKQLWFMVYTIILKKYLYLYQQSCDRNNFLKVNKIRITFINN